MDAGSALMQPGGAQGRGEEATLIACLVSWAVGEPFEFERAGDVASVMEHKWFSCGSGCSLTFCAFCQGGLRLCLVCGGAEGTLTTECCGRQMTPAEQDAVAVGGELDYCDGGWLRAARPTDAASSSIPDRAAESPCGNGNGHGEQGDRLENEAVDATGSGLSRSGEDGSALSRPRR